MQHFLPLFLNSLKITRGLLPELLNSVSCMWLLGDDSCWRATSSYSFVLYINKSITKTFDSKILMKLRDMSHAKILLPLSLYIHL